MKNTVVFIICEKRSGSTWLSFVLGSHASAVCLGEYYRFFTSMDLAICSLCHGKGKKECEVLYGIHKKKPDEAFDFAFERTKKNILIDNSKETGWADKFLYHDRFQAKLIHLVREPRGWFASEKRRTEMSVADAMQRWLGNNANIKNFIEKNQAQHMLVFYDDLAREPKRYFPQLCDFIGMPFETTALEYWNFQHHGPGGNGAAYDVIGQYPNSILITGDDKYYQQKSKQPFYDQRWKKHLNTEQISYIEQNPEIKAFLSTNNRKLEDFF